MSGTHLHVSDDSGTGSKLREWSSLIGIVTAIVGNILISFALNIQRYAHIRLAREQEEQKKPWNTGRAKNGQSDYGTQQSKIAEDRIRTNLNAPLEDEQPTNGHNPTEDYTHVPGAHNESLHSRSSSESTIKQSEKPKPQAEKKTYLKSPYWWIGIILMIAGEAGNFIAYGFAPASIVSPLGVVALVSNCIIAPCLLHERFRQRDLWGVVIAIAGAVTIVLSAKSSETKMGPHDVWAAITRWEFETYLGITAALIIVLTWASGRYGEKTILIDLGLVALCGKYDLKRPIVAELTKMTGGYTALSTKGVASLLSDTLWRALTFPITYLLVFILVVSALAQIRYVNRALQSFDSTQVIPVQFVLFTISVIIGSAVLYRDFQSADASQFGKFFGGCALTFLGVYLITSGRAGEGSEGNADGLDDEENTIGLVDEERYQDEADSNEEGMMRRKSSVSFILGGPNGSRRSSQQQVDRRLSATRTPPRLLSHTSTASSRMSGTDSPTLEEPCLSTDNVSASSRPRLGDSAITSPLLPSEAQRSHPPASPNAPSTPRRPSRLSKSSMARLTPGPYVSPLSSSLSAVVADEIRRGQDSPSTRRRPSGLRKSKSQRATIASNGDEIGSTPLKASQLPEEAVVDEHSERPHTAIRSQSVSANFAAVGDSSRRNQEGRKGKANESDENDTPQ